MDQKGALIGRSFLWVIFCLPIAWGVLMSLCCTSNQIQISDVRVFALSLRYIRWILQYKQNLAFCCFPANVKNFRGNKSFRGQTELLLLTIRGQTVLLLPTVRGQTVLLLPTFRGQTVFLLPTFRSITCLSATSVTLQKRTNKYKYPSAIISPQVSFDSKQHYRRGHHFDNPLVQQDGWR
jgi:hypothetical protein